MAATLPRRVVGVGLMLMSFSSGCMDVLSYRFLGQVFTSAMTGNIAFMGLSLGQGNLAGASRNAAAFVSFIAGLALGAVLFRRGTERWRAVMVVAIEALLLAAFAAFWRARGVEAGLYGLIALSAVAMGVQSAIAHRIGMPGITTTYFTGTMTGIVFGIVGPVPTPGVPAARRVAWPLLAFAAYVVGAMAAGWSTAGRSATELGLALPALPCVATVLLAVGIAAVPRGKPPVAAS